MEPMKLQPVCKDYLWGGSRLSGEFNKGKSGEAIAESWEVSCHPDGMCAVESGLFAGRLLADVLRENPHMLGEKGADCAEFPILIKLIDAEQNLSLQVHPDDGYARREESSLGKNEMWYVMDCAENARLILGFKRPVSRDEMRAKILDNSILDCVNSVPVAPGDCFCIPAGMLHAIGGGILVAEVQQSSNITYRVYDYGRRDADGNLRQLHIDKAIEVTDTALIGEKSRFPIEEHGGYRFQRLADWRYFQCSRYETDIRVELTAGADSFHCLLCVDGGMELIWNGQAISLDKGTSAFIPAGLGDYTVEGQGVFLLTTL